MGATSVLGVTTLPSVIRAFGRSFAPYWALGTLALTAAIGVSRVAYYALKNQWENAEARQACTEADSSRKLAAFQRRLAEYQSACETISPYLDVNLPTLPSQAPPPIEGLEIFPPERTPVQQVHALAEDLVKFGRPGCDVQNLQTWTSRFQGISLRHPSILELVQALVEGQLDEAKIKELPDQLREPIFRMAIEAVADKKIREIYPDWVVDAFGGKLPYVPVIPMKRHHLDGIGKPQSISKERASASVLRWVDAYRRPGFAVLHEGSRSDPQKGLARSPHSIVKKYDTFFQRYTDTPKAWYAGGLAWLGSTRLTQQLGVFLHGRDPVKGLKVIQDRIYSLVNSLPVGNEDWITGEFGPAFEDDTGKPTVRLTPVNVR